MLDFSKQFAVIAKLKSLVKFTKGLKALNNEKNQITEAIARKIQKSSYEHTHRTYTENYTPPYKVIAEQLQVENDQIFKAAVFNLTNIAINRRQYKQEIIDLLQKTAEDSNRSKEQITYIQTKIAQINR